MKNRLEKEALVGVLMLGTALVVGGIISYNHSRKEDDNSTDPLTEHYLKLAPNPQTGRVYVPR